MDILKASELADVLKRIVKAQAVLDKHNKKSIDKDTTPKQRRNAIEDAREAAIEIRYLKHEAHCLAVEFGIADRRDDSHYQDSFAPAGFGRETIFHKRAPHAA